MENILEETKFIMKKYNIRANKSLGQNFLINSEVVENIVNSSEINKEDMVIEDAEFTEVEDIDTKSLDEAMKSLS